MSKNTIASRAPGRLPRAPDFTEGWIIIRVSGPCQRFFQLFEISSWSDRASSAFCFFRDGIRKIQEKWLHYALNSKSPEFLEAFSKANPIRNPERIRALEAYLASFEAFCRQNGIEPIYVYLPLSDSFRLNDILAQIGADPGEFDASFYETLMRSYCENAKMRLIDLTPVLKQAFEEGHELRFKLDPHFNLFANRLIGEYLVQSLF